MVFTMRRCQTAVVLCLALAAASANAARLTTGQQALSARQAAPSVAAAPAFCHNLDCPKFTVVDSKDDYEVRYYEAGVWVSTDVESYAYALAANTGFKRLYQYIDGANHDAAKIPMTAPVRTMLNASAGPFCKAMFTISFFVPFAYQDKVPKPNNPDVYIQPAEAFTAYVGQSGGFVLDDYSVQRMANRLKQALDADEQPYETDSFYFAGYDSPFRLTGRHNEVWFVAKEDSPSALQV